VLAEIPLDGARERPAAPIDVAWGPEGREGRGLLREGTFESPEARLPPAVRRVRVRMLRPAAGAPRAVCLHFAASGDQGFAMRLRFAAPLLEQGIAAVVLENPYYGARRPPGQPGAALRTVADMVLMATAAVREGRSLLAWLEERGHRRLGVAGYSMGGQMCAMVAITWPRPLAVAALAPSDSPASVFTEGLLASHPCWDALRRPGGTDEDARAELRRFLLRYAVSGQPPPVAPRAAVVVANRRDAVVSPAEAERIAAHWGCELRWLKGGHVSAAILEHSAMRRAVADALARLLV
jgi:pimeloyl-ACP methyl ester carboxylesterase